jgi:hypothetical protein
VEGLLPMDGFDEIEIWNPERDWLTGDELAVIADAVGHPVRQIMARI